MSQTKNIQEILDRWKSLQSDNVTSESALLNIVLGDLPHVTAALETTMQLATHATELLENAFSMPKDTEGIRIRSEDAVKLQWALQQFKNTIDSETVSPSLPDNCL